MQQSENLRVAMIHGVASSMGNAVALELAGSGTKLVLFDECVPASFRESLESGLADRRAEFVFLANGQLNSSGRTPAEKEAALVNRANEVWGRLDILVNLDVPSSATTAAELYEYPHRLLERGLCAAQYMAACTDHGAIVNQCFLPSIYAGTHLETHIPSLKGAITGVTRTLGRKLGQHGVRVNTIQTGLIDLPELKDLANSKVLLMKPPVGRWGTAEEVAKFVSFLCLKNGYMTGQAVVMDGGMTAGLTGT